MAYLLSIDIPVDALLVIFLLLFNVSKLNIGAKTNNF